MAVLEGQRLEVAERELRSSGEREYADPERYKRIAGERAPSYRKTAVHMRDDYGMTMDDSQYSAIEANRIAFEKAMAEGRAEVSAYESQLAGAQTQLDEQGNLIKSEYADARGQIDSASMEMGHIPTWDQWKAGQGQVHIMSDGQYQYSYNLSSDAIHSMAGKIQAYNASNENDMDMQSAENGISIDVHGYGAEISEDLQHAQNMTKIAFDTEVAKANNQVSAFEAQKAAAYGSLEGQYSGAMGMLGQEQGKLGIAREHVIAANNRMDFLQENRQTTLNGLRKQYSNRLSRIKDSIGAVINRKNTGDE